MKRRNRALNERARRWNRCRQSARGAHQVVRVRRANETDQARTDCCAEPKIEAAITTSPRPSTSLFAMRRPMEVPNERFFATAQHPRLGKRTHLLVVENANQQTRSQAQPRDDLTRRHE